MWVSTVDLEGACQPYIYLCVVVCVHRLECSVRVIGAGDAITCKMDGIISCMTVTMVTAGNRECYMCILSILV